MAPSSTRPIFVRDVADPEVADAKRYGGKASGLSRMMAAGVPAPPAFVIGAEGFHRFRSNGRRVGDGIMSEVRDALRRLEAATGRSFGGVERPLLVSVRSGAAVSMPGMMDTILNLGLTARSALTIAQGPRGPRFALDTWIRFWRMFFDTVLNLDPTELAGAAHDLEKRGARVPIDRDLRGARAGDPQPYRRTGRARRRRSDGAAGTAVAAVFRSWDSARAKAYRQHHGISDDLGTAVTIQSMVFGNADENSGSGVAFTRNPNDGTKALYGEYLIGRQGEDLVAGTHSPIDLSDPDSMDLRLRSELIGIGGKLEGLYRDAVDIEFTVESGRLYILQVRAAKRTAVAAMRVAADLVSEGLIDVREAVSRINAGPDPQAFPPGFRRERAG